MRSDQYKNSIILDRSLVPGYRWPWALWGRSCAMHICSSTTTRLRPTLPRTKVEAAAFLCRFALAVSTQNPRIPRLCSGLLAAASSLNLQNQQR